MANRHVLTSTSGSNSTCNLAGVTEILNDIIIIFLLLLMGLAAVAIRWGMLGLHLFGKAYHQFYDEVVRAFRGWRQLWTNPCLRLAVLAVVLVLAGWLSILNEEGMEETIDLISGGTP